MSLRRPARLLAACTVALLGTAGCASQIAGLAPVGGDAMSGLRSAATDVLVAKRMSIVEAPVCTKNPDSYTCVGSLADGSRIDVTAPADGSTMTITVSGQEIFSGKVSDVLASAAAGTLQ